MEGDYFLIDCGEGTQHQLVRLGLRMHRIRYILISHLHGDHFYGLPGLVSSMALFGRTEKLTIIGPAALQSLMENIISLTEARVPFEVEYIVTDAERPALVMKTRQWSLETVPLRHRIACTGFILREQGPERKLNVSVCEQMGVPVSVYEELKWGEDWHRPDGEIIPNHVLTIPGSKNRSYAYISDTIADENILPHISGVDLLYHEATFLHELKARAAETYHTTALQAGEMATRAGAGRLLIGHFSSRYAHTDDLLAEARSAFSNTEAAEEGLTYPV